MTKQCPENPNTPYKHEWLNGVGQNITCGHCGYETSYRLWKMLYSKEESK